MTTNYEHYFGTPESVVNIEVKFHSWPRSISLYDVEPFSAQTWGIIVSNTLKLNRNIWIG